MAATATVTFQNAGTWTNAHENVTQPYERLYYITPPDVDNNTTIVQAMFGTMVAFQGILRDAIAAGTRLRCLGGSWSLSDAAATDGWLVSTKSLNYQWTLGAEELNPAYPKPIEGLFFLQCGNSIQEVNTLVEGMGRSLITMGASNGQTIAGAIATGTHGSAFQFGAMQDYVVGLYLLPEPDTIIYLERASYPVVTDEFAAELGAELIRDNDLFNAALVSFGSFGITAAVMIETEPLCLFETERRVLVLEGDLQTGLRTAMDTLVLTGAGTPHPDEIPWHFEATFNPHDAGHAYIRTLYKRPYPDTDGHPQPDTGGGQLGPGEGLLSVIGTITQLLGAASAPLVMSELVGSSLKPVGPVWGTNSQIFSTTTLEGIAMSMEIGIALEDSTKVLDLLYSLSPQINSYAGVISYRWVKRTTATLGFTKFPVTTTIEFNAAHNQDTLNYYQAIWGALAAQNIPYTLHWGQMNNFTPALVSGMYGDAVNQWMAARDKLMTPASKAVFTSRFLQSTGLG